MEDFPWAAVIAAGSGLIIATIQLTLTVFSLDARISKTAKLLKQVGDIRPDGDAERALRDALDVLAARKTARVIGGNSDLWWLLAWVEGSLVLYFLLFNTGVGTASFWTAVVTAVVCLVIAGIKYRSYLTVSARYHSVRD